MKNILLKGLFASASFILLSSLASAANNLELSTTGNYQNLIGKDILPQVIGIYERKEVELNRQNCNPESGLCFLRSRYKYTSATDSYTVDISVSTSTFSKEFIANEILQMKNKYSYTGDICFYVFDGGISCFMPNKNVFLDISHSTHFISETELKGILNSTSTDLYHVKQRANIVKSPVVKTILSKFSFTLGEWADAMSSLPSNGTTSISQDSSSYQSSCVLLTKNLSKGQETSDVRKLQQFLIDGGYLTTKPNGYFGQQTKKALENFQVANSLLKVGTVGPQTRKRIRDLSCTVNVTTLKKEPQLPKNTLATISAPSTQQSQTPSSSSTDAVQVYKDAAVTRNAKRQSDVKNLLVALDQYKSDNNLALPDSITTVPTEICRTTGSICSGRVDVGVLLGKYIQQIPKDPTVLAILGTGYFISKKTNGMITISAILAEDGQVISETK